VSLRGFFLETLQNLTDPKLLDGHAHFKLKETVALILKNVMAMPVGRHTLRDGNKHKDQKTSTESECQKITTVLTYRNLKIHLSQFDHTDIQYIPP